MDLQSEHRECDVIELAAVWGHVLFTDHWQFVEEDLAGAFKGHAAGEDCAAGCLLFLCWDGDQVFGLEEADQDILKVRFWYVAFEGLITCDYVSAPDLSSNLACCFKLQKASSWALTWAQEVNNCWPYWRIGGAFK